MDHTASSMHIQAYNATPNLQLRGYRLQNERCTDEGMAQQNQGEILHIHGRCVEDRNLLMGL